MSHEVRATLRDPELQEQLSREGYVILPLLDEHALEILESGFDALGPAPGDAHQACHSSFQSFDAAYKREVDSLLTRGLGPAVDAIADRQRLLPGSFISKWPGDRSGFGLHQDLALVDEAKHLSVVVWAALDDATEENGQLWVVPRSHRWRVVPRGVHAFDFPYTAVAERLIQRHSLAMDVPRGHAVVFANSLLHFSPPNRSGKRRRVALTQIIPEEADNLHYLGDGRGAVDVYRITDRSFWIDTDPFLLWTAPPGLDRVASIEDSSTPATDADIDALVAAGLAIESTSAGPGAPNTDYAWCHRCGSTEVIGDPPHPWVGNVTLMCGPCRQAEPGRAGVSSRPRALVDPGEQDRLDVDGFVVSSLLGEAEVAAAQAVADSIGLDDRHATFATTNDLPGDEAARIDTELRRILRPRLRDLLPGHEALVAGVVSKGATIGTGHPLHQDISFTDERLTRSVVVWIPLVDVGADSAALRVVPGSHLWTDGSRPGCTTPPTTAIQDLLDPLAERLDLRAGEAVVYDAALIHGSGPNISGTPRPAVVVALVPRGATLVHVHEGQDGAEAFRVGPVFHTHGSVYDAPVDYPAAELWAAPVTTAELVVALEPPPPLPPPQPQRAPRLGPAIGRGLLPPPARPVLVDTPTDHRLRRDGFVHLPGRVDHRTVRVLKNLFGRVHGWVGTGFEADLQNTDRDYRRTTSDLLTHHLDDLVGELFVDHSPYLRSYLCKWPGEGSDLNLHRDWMYIDERDGDHTYVVWIPLVDVGTAEGPLEVLRHSHRLDPMVRGTGLYADWVMDEELVGPRLLTVPARAGDVVILDNALVHRSGPNWSGRPRPVAAVGMRPRQAPLVHFRRESDDSAVRYDVDEHFFLTSTPLELMDEAPDLPVAETLAVEAAISPAEVRTRLRTSPLTHTDELSRRVAAIRGRSRPAR